MPEIEFVFSYSFLQVKLSATKLEFFDAVSGASLLSRVASMESELAKFSTDISADLGHMQHGLMTAKEDIQGQATKLEKEISEISTGMERMDMKMEMKLSETTCSLDELSEKVAALGMDLKEQTMTASPPNDYSESGFASVKQDALATEAFQIQFVCFYIVEFEVTISQTFPCFTIFSHLSEQGS